MTSSRAGTWAPGVSADAHPSAARVAATEASRGPLAVVTGGRACPSMGPPLVIDQFLPFLNGDTLRRSSSAATFRHHMVPVGVALIGAGRWGLTVASTLCKLETVDLRWICELEGDRLARAAALFPRASVTDRVAEALSDDRVEAAFVAVDSARHHAVGIRVLESGRHLLVENPRALSSADAAEL